MFWFHEKTFLKSVSFFPAIGYLTFFLFRLMKVRCELHFFYSHLGKILWIALGRVEIEVCEKYAELWSSFPANGKHATFVLQRSSCTPALL